MNKRPDKEFAAKMKAGGFPTDFALIGRICDAGTLFAEADAPPKCAQCGQVLDMEIGRFCNSCQSGFDTQSLIAEAEEVFGKLPAGPTSDTPIDRLVSLNERIDIQALKAVSVCDTISPEEIIRVGREMRRWQKRFFKAGNDKEERKLALSMSIPWEKQFDALIAPKDEKQLDMFGQEASSGD